MTIRAHFDGQRIHLPRELEGHAPCEVEITLADETRNETARRSIWDVVAQSHGTCDAATILRETSAERDDWSRP
jgi:hypothetical protein